MHNLALALQQQGHTVTGSDDTIYEPSRTRLQQYNLLPQETGWFPDKITPDLDAVIVGMHAGKDNPELTRALALGLPIYSYPEYIYQQSRQKQRVVITGSHGKTTITAIILHVLKYHNRIFDYWIGEPIDEFDSTVRLSPQAPLIIIEGDEYASSPIDERPKFLHYQPHIALISGIAWDHINLYPTWEEYVDQFESLAEAMPKAGILIFDESDDMLDVIGQKERADITEIPYFPHPAETLDGKTYLLTKQKNRIPINLFGQHNLKNIAGAMTVCDRIGITEEQFYQAISTFKGIEKRLEIVASKNGRIVYFDLAHSPAKVEAATEAVKQHHTGKKLMAIFDLHSALNINNEFLEQYKNTMNAADEAIIYFNQKQSTGNRQIKTADLLNAFDQQTLHVFTDASTLQNYLIQHRNSAQIFLLMSANSFDGLDISTLAQNILS